MSDQPADDLRSEYPADLIRSGERGKYAARSRQGTIVVPTSGAGQLLNHWRKLPPVDPDDLRNDLDSLLDPRL